MGGTCLSCPHGGGQSLKGLMGLAASAVDRQETKHKITGGAIHTISSWVGPQCTCAADVQHPITQRCADSAPTTVHAWQAQTLTDS